MLLEFPACVVPPSVIESPYVSAPAFVVSVSRVPRTRRVVSFNLRRCQYGVQAFLGRLILRFYRRYLLGIFTLSCSWERDLTKEGVEPNPGPVSQFTEESVWVRDLTQEGVEPNPGPPVLSKEKPDGFFRRLFRVTKFVLPVAVCVSVASLPDHFLEGGTLVNCLHSNPLALSAFVYAAFSSTMWAQGRPQLKPLQVLNLIFACAVRPAIQAYAPDVIRAFYASNGPLLLGLVWAPLVEELIKGDDPWDHLAFGFAEAIVHTIPTLQSIHNTDPSEFLQHFGVSKIDCIRFTIRSLAMRSILQGVVHFTAGTFGHTYGGRVFLHLAFNIKMLCPGFYSACWSKVGKFLRPLSLAESLLAQVVTLDRSGPSNTNIEEHFQRTQTVQKTIKQVWVDRNLAQLQKDHRTVIAKESPPMTVRLTSGSRTKPWTYDRILEPVRGDYLYLHPLKRAYFYLLDEARKSMPAKCVTALERVQWQVDLVTGLYEQASDLWISTSTQRKKYASKCLSLVHKCVNEAHQKQHKAFQFADEATAYATLKANGSLDSFISTVGQAKELAVGAKPLLIKKTNEQLFLGFEAYSLVTYGVRKRFLRTVDEIGLLQLHFMSFCCPKMRLTMPHIFVQIDSACRTFFLFTKRSLVLLEAHSVLRNLPALVRAYCGSVRVLQPNVGAVSPPNTVHEVLGDLGACLRASLAPVAPQIMGNFSHITLVSHRDLTQYPIVEALAKLTHTYGFQSKNFVLPGDAGQLVGDLQQGAKVQTPGGLGIVQGYSPNSAYGLLPHHGKTFLVIVSSGLCEPAEYVVSLQARTPHGLLVHVEYRQNMPGVIPSNAYFRSFLFESARVFGNWAIFFNLRRYFPGFVPLRVEPRLLLTMEGASFVEFIAPTQFAVNVEGLLPTACLGVSKFHALRSVHRLSDGTYGFTEQGENNLMAKTKVAIYDSVTPANKPALEAQLNTITLGVSLNALESAALNKEKFGLALQGRNLKRI